jgi:Putative Actinobacterial Holin-X, holin superfamily III
MTNEPSSIADLLKNLRDDTSNLVQDEISLAKTEIAEKLSSASRNVGYLVAGGLVAYAGLLVLLQGVGLPIRKLFIAAGMDEASATVLGFLIAGAVVAGIGIAVVVKALETLKKEPLTPTKTAETLKQDKQWVQNKIS